MSYDSNNTRTGEFSSHEIRSDELISLPENCRSFASSGLLSSSLNIDIPHILLGETYNIIIKWRMLLVLDYFMLRRWYFFFHRFFFIIAWISLFLSLRCESSVALWRFLERTYTQFLENLNFVMKACVGVRWLSLACRSENKIFDSSDLVAMLHTRENGARKKKVRE